MKRGALKGAVSGLQGTPRCEARSRCHSAQGGHDHVCDDLGRFRVRRDNLLRASGYARKTVAPDIEEPAEQRTVITLSGQIVDKDTGELIGQLSVDAAT